MKRKRSRVQGTIFAIMIALVFQSTGSFAQIQTPKISPITITPTVNGNTTTTIDPAPAAAAAAQAAENEVLKATMAQQAAELERQKQQLQEQQQQQQQLQKQEAIQQGMLMQQSGKGASPGAAGAPGQARPADGTGYTVIPEDQGFNAPAPTTTSTTLGDYSEFVTDVKKGKPTITKKKKSGAIMYAIFETSKGTFKAKLFESLAPKTVDNFVGLAKGTKEWMDPKSNTMVHRPFYDGLTFHRVIPQFMIQGGDPVGNGTGGPGYQFDDEIVPTLHHNKAGILSMANAGPNTNGSQFFITVAPATYLDGKYNIFGEIVEGQKIVDEISKVKRNSRDLPNEPVVIKHVKIVEK